VNVSLNAIQAMPNGGRLFLRSYSTDFSRLPKEIQEEWVKSSLLVSKAVVIEIEDEGIGISEENLKKIFEPFFTTKGEMLGVGLGLPVVKDIITMHSGYIEIKSKINQGTKATIFLKAQPDA
jgi:signal transduction histidine kinase